MSVYADHNFNLGSQNNSWAHLYELIPEGSRVLDVGCSTAAFGKVLIENKKCDVTGIDLDETDITEARKNIGKALVMDINSDEASKLGKFDVIIFADVLEHLIDPRATLERLKRDMINKGGVILFSIPHMAHTSVRLQLLKGTFDYKERGLLDRTHLHFYDQHEVESMFADAGYQVIVMRPTISEYPKQMVEAKLTEVGLKTTPRFYDMLKQTNGSIFQFIGAAKPITAKTAIKRSLEYIMPHDEILEYNKAILDENKQLHDEAQKLHHENLRLASNIEQIKRHPLRFGAGYVSKKVLKRVKKG
jgi:2-polyprenyl-3-methyl-5-hydroxy-6-metoxy-1,4-benzoquinol methylase